MLSEIFSKKKKGNGIFLGAPEAEAEASSSSRMPLLETYEDFHDIASAIDAEKFIIIGRKGCGKSAFAEYVTLKAERSATTFAKFVRKTEVAVERLVQQAGSLDESSGTAAFFRWMVLVNILSLIAKSEAAKHDSRFSHLRKFLDINSGYVDIRELELKEVVKKHGWEVSTGAFQKYFRGKYNRDINIKSERAAFYKLLPHLEVVVVDLLLSDLVVSNRNAFLVFFDDLDLSYHARRKESQFALMELIRTCKEINNDLFGKRGVNAKAVILLRDDIEADLSSVSADSAKIFASYSCRISWYQDGYLQHISGNEFFLKRFIDKRIKIAFRSAGRVIVGHAWDALIAYDLNENDQFKWILNKTMYRPRDILLFFKPLENGYFDYPLDGGALRTLSREFASQLVSELKNEMSSFFDSPSIERIFSALGEIDKLHDCKFDSALDILSFRVPGEDPESILTYLFDRSIVGNKNAVGWFTFKCRHPAGQAGNLNIDRAQAIVVQYGVQDYLSRRGY
jgi:hypothetical protein